MLTLTSQRKQQVLNKQLVREKLKALREIATYPPDTGDDYGETQYKHWKDDVTKLLEDLDSMFYPRVHVSTSSGNYHLWVDGAIVMSINIRNSPFGDLSKETMGLVATKMLGHPNYIWCNTSPETKDGTYE